MEMASTHIRHVLQTRPTFFYSGVAYLSSFKTYQSKQVCNFEKISEKKTDSCSNFVKFPKDRHFIRRNQVYFSSSNVSTDTPGIVKD